MNSNAEVTKSTTMSELVKSRCELQPKSKNHENTTKPVLMDVNNPTLVYQF